MRLVICNGNASFWVHKNLLIEKSAFFKEAFETMRFTKGSEQIMELAEKDRDVFELFVQWLYDGKKALPNLVGLEKDPTDVMLAVHLWVLAHDRQVEGLQREIMDRLVKTIDRESDYAPSMEVIKYVYGSATTQESAIRKLIADWVGWRGGASVWKAELVQMPAFAADLACWLRP